jgi:glycosyltransferase involved in cell wall biosynthesis
VATDRPGPEHAAETRALRFLVTVTFTRNQLRSHLAPLVSLPEVEAVTLVADVEPPPLPKLRTVVPPRWMMRLLGRAGAKLVVCLWLAIRERPDWVVGFNIMPHGLNARIVGGLTGTKSLYHMIGGELEWLGGGYRSDNRVMSLLPRPVPPLERLLLKLMRGCTGVATMGEAGRRILLARGFDPDRVHVFPPSVDTERFRPSANGDAPEYDILNIGALISRKRTADLLEAVARIRPRHPALRVAVLGEGPLEDDLRRRATALGVADCVDFLGFREDVEQLHARSGVFVLPAAFEGLPVAMLEAMASGLPPVMTDVGEIGWFIREGETGFLVPAGDVERLAGRLDELLADADTRSRVGAAAAEDVRARVSIEAISQRYRELLAAHR